MAEFIKHKYGMKLLLDFHYSHWWTDGSNQWIPLSWRKQTRDGQEVLPSSRELQDLVYHHTYEFLEALLAQGTFPDAVQVGNEIMVGILRDEGRIPDHWKDFVQITHSGVQAIQDVVSSSSLSSSSWFKKVLAAIGAAKVVAMPKIVIHLDQGGYRKGCEEWFQSYLDLGGKVDIIGLSYYPMWHGSFKDLANNVNNLASKFNRDVWIVETAYFWKGNPCDENDWKCEFLFPFDQSEKDNMSICRLFGMCWKPRRLGPWHSFIGDRIGPNPKNGLWGTKHGKKHLVVRSLMTKGGLLRVGRLGHLPELLDCFRDQVGSRIRRAVVKL